MNKEGHQNYQNPSSKFQSAIDNLAKFTNSNKSSSVPHIFDLDLVNETLIEKSRSSFRKVVKFSWHFVESIFFNNQREQEEVQRELLKSVDIVKKHHLVLDRMKNGSEEQQKLATVAQDVINRYNLIVKQAKKGTPSVKTHVVKFLYKSLGFSIDDLLKNTIDLPIKVSLKSDSPKANHFSLVGKKISQEIQNISSEKISLLATSLHHGYKQGCQLTQKELDAYSMKAIAMIRNFAFPVASITETLKTIRTTPIMMHLESLEDSISIVHLSQKLALFPGEVIELQGAFKRDANSSVISVPIPDSFQLQSKSVQTGFPHPSQHHGLSFSDKLIPAFLIRPELLPSLQDLLMQKKKVAEELLPSGKHIDKARVLLQLKRDTFNSDPAYFFDLHKKLAMAIVKAQFSDVSVEAIQIIDLYFQLIETQTSSYDILSETNQIIVDRFIDYPSDRLEETWIGGSIFNSKDSWITGSQVVNFLNAEFEKVQNEMRYQYKKTSNEVSKAILKYVLLMGPIVAKGTTLITLQLFSEKMEFSPPALTPFAKLIQSSVYQQAQSFHQEQSMELCTPKEMHSHLTKLLEQDILLFSVNPEQSVFITQLEQYFIR